ncbi:TlpA disulfide reductase family protein [Kordiimonas marina]|uniref:TlpA disulfide reductase family protein n=1 Tax=Kordiimonas marina TaxID=2872312 RepID=UPI001FF363A3|nr:TlpA disulfide reductase family protein [Kordiimonas marina]MCJ9428412.1 TlpA family protein disulfide reductase [Kordiimonas marina]
MPKKALILIVGLIVAIGAGAAAYRAMMPGTMSDAPINSYLKGEMAKLSLPEKPVNIGDYRVLIPGERAIRISSLKGKALLVNIWAPWCAPCREEMPELANLQKKLGDDKFEVVAISVGKGSLGEAQDTLDEWGIKGLNVYADPSMKIAFELAKGALPTSFIVGADGKVRAMYLGPLKWDGDDAVKLFTALKAGKI